MVTKCQNVLIPYIACTTYECQNAYTFRVKVANHRSIKIQYKVACKKQECKYA